MTKKSRQKHKYLENEKNEVKSIFHHFKRASNAASNTIFLGGESPTLKIDMQRVEKVQ